MAAVHGGGTNGPTFKAGDVVDHAANGFNPTEILRDFDYGQDDGACPAAGSCASGSCSPRTRRSRSLPASSTRPGPTTGAFPGPTLRATEGDLLRVRFLNGSAHPHTMHFHGFHRPRWTACRGSATGVIEPGGSTTYEFDAEPFGLHLYHCHVEPPRRAHRPRHVRGPDHRPASRAGRRPTSMVMVMNGFNTNFDAEGNQVYAVNTVAFHYNNEPIQVKRDELVRIYLVNILEYDPINSFHIHANFFDYYPTGTRLEPREFTDTVVQGQARARDLRDALPVPGRVHVPRPQDRVRRARLDGLLRGQLMEARSRPGSNAMRRASRRARAALGARLVPLALIVGALIALLTLGGDTLGERRGPPVEDIAVERTVLRPGEIELTVRNVGPDPVDVAQVFVNDSYVDFSSRPRRGGSARQPDALTLDYPWQEGSPLLITMLTSTGATVEHEIDGRRRDARGRRRLLRADGAAGDLRRA